MGESAWRGSPFTVLALEYDCNILHAETFLTETFALRKQSYVEMRKSKSKDLDSCPKAPTDRSRVLRKSTLCCEELSISAPSMKSSPMKQFGFHDWIEAWSCAVRAREGCHTP